MKPFRTSFTARMVSLSIAFALLGGGLIPTLGLRPDWAVPIVLVLAIGGSVVGLVFGVNNHLGAIVLCAVLLPMALWAYVLLLLVVVNHFPAYAYALDAAGAAVLFSTVLASFVARAPEAKVGVAHAWPSTAAPLPSDTATGSTGTR